MGRSIKVIITAIKNSKDYEQRADILINMYLDTNPDKEDIHQMLNNAIHYQASAKYVTTLTKSYINSLKS